MRLLVLAGSAEPDLPAAKSKSRVALIIAPPSVSVITTLRVLPPRPLRSEGQRQGVTSLSTSMTSDGPLPLHSPMAAEIHALNGEISSVFAQGGTPGSAV